MEAREYLQLILNGENFVEIWRILQLACVFTDVVVEVIKVLLLEDIDRADKQYEDKQ